MDTPNHLCGYVNYQHRSFSVSMTGSDSASYRHAEAVCRESGHMETDVRGKCLRCGERIDPAAEINRLLADRHAHYVRVGIRSLVDLPEARAVQEAAAKFREAVIAQRTGK